MGFLSAADIAELWGMSERTVRNCRTQVRVRSTFLTGKIWNIPADATKPARSNAKSLGESPIRIDDIVETHYCWHLGRTWGKMR